jgi:hypothetical protein
MKPAISMSERLRQMREANAPKEKVKAPKRKKVR